MKEQNRAGKEPGDSGIGKEAKKSFGRRGKKEEPLSKVKRKGRAAKPAADPAEGMGEPTVFPRRDLLFYRGTPLVQYEVVCPPQEDAPLFLQDMVQSWVAYCRGEGLGKACETFDKDERRHKRRFYPLFFRLTVGVAQGPGWVSYRFEIREGEDHFSFGFLWDPVQSIILKSTELGVKHKGGATMNLLCRDGKTLYKFLENGDLKEIFTIES